MNYFLCRYKYLKVKHKGSAALAVIIVLAIICSMIGLSMAKMSQTAMNSTSSNKIAIQANNLASSDAEFIRSIEYKDLTPTARSTISGTPFQHEISISRETSYSDTIKQKTAIIKVYNSNETIPRAEIQLVRYSVEKKPSGVPIGTIIAWPSTKNPVEGTWLDCNGQSCAAYPELVNVLGKNTVPNYINRFLEGNATPGNYIEAGLPNITGYIGAGWMSGSGVFKNYKYWGASGDGHGYPATDSCSFDASRSSPIYGRSTTVQPPAVTVRWLIKAAA